MNINDIGELTPEQISELAAKAKLADELLQKNEQFEKEKANLVEELKVERQKKQLAESVVKQKADGSPDDIAAITREIVAQALAEKESTQIETTRKDFENTFKNSNPEFTPANDPGGIKYEAFKKVLGRFNTTNARTEQELKQVYGDAMLILRGGQRSSTDSETNKFAFSPTSKGEPTGSSNDNDLSTREQKLLQQSGWTKEKYLKFRSTQPQFVNQLLESVRD